MIGMEKVSTSGVGLMPTKQKNLLRTFHLVPVTKWSKNTFKVPGVLQKNNVVIGDDFTAHLCSMLPYVPEYTLQVLTPFLPSAFLFCVRK